MPLNLITTSTPVHADVVNPMITKINENEAAILTKQDKLITPVETVITSGFATGWSGEIRIRRSVEGLFTLYINLTKTSNISSGGETVFTLPTNLRPLKTTTFAFNPSTAAFVYSKAIANLVIYNTGEIYIPASTQDLTGATTIPRISIDFY